MLWAQSPGRRENEKSLELVGDSGKLLWRALRPVGMRRKDFDIQNVLRCLPVDNAGHSVPSDDKQFKRALRCCSVYNEEALERNADSAAVHLVLGEVAGKQLFGADYKKSVPLFWHEPWNAYIVLNHHPAYLLRQGGESAGWPYSVFCDRMRAVQACIQHPGRWGYVKAQDYGAAHTVQELRKLKRLLYSEAKAGRRVSVDLEEGWVDGVYRVLMVGFGWGKYVDPARWDSWQGGARSVVLWHPEADCSQQRIAPLLKELRSIIGDPKLEKVLQHGSHDDTAARKLLRARLCGHTFDTQYGTYLWHSHLRSYSLESTIRNFLPEFMDYKSTMLEGANGNFANVPLESLVLYNCADCDVTKRAEALCSPHVRST
jgi:uracil-DNA glycosylase family 4